METAGIGRLMVALARHVSPRRRRQFAWLLGLTIITSVAEVASLGTVLPFIAVLTQPQRVFESPRVAWLAQRLGLETVSDVMLAMALAFAITAIIAGALRLAVLWGSIRLANATGADVSLEVYRRTLYQPYPVHVSRSSSEIISAMTQKVSITTGLLISLSYVVTAGLLFFAILSTLIAIDPKAATIAMLIFGVGYGVIGWVARRRLVGNSELVSKEQTKVVKALQEGLGAIRDVLLDGTQAIYCAVYGSAVQKLQRAGGENTFINQAPRFAMETLAMVLVAGLGVYLSRSPENVGDALPVLGALGLGAQRLLPLLQQMYGNWAIVKGSQAALFDVVMLLEQPLPPDAELPPPAPLAFHRAIRFEGVRFCYAMPGTWVLDGLDLEIRKGERIGLVGGTGSGKSTILDLLMALLEPVEGRILVDGDPIAGERRRAWQRAIAHVPQAIYLADTTIAENIAFGVPPEDVDLDRVKRAARHAQIADFIEGREGGYFAMVGERGVRLSGGQRQRIGIARALYREATVLVFDEATSALDGTTEEAVMTAIDGLDRHLTIIVVAHRLTTLQRCDRIVHLHGGTVRNFDSYTSFINEGGSGALQPVGSS